MKNCYGLGRRTREVFRVKQTLAPVALFAYRRPRHLQAVLGSLSANAEADATNLVIFVDAAGDESEQAPVASTVAIARQATGFRSVSVQVSREHRGLAQSIVGGVRQMLSEYGRVVILEDDIQVSPYFLRFMNDGLETYADDSSVASIHGYRYPVRHTLPETFFLRGADCWGWGTWRRAWNQFEPDGSLLLSQLRERGLERDFDFGGAASFTKMLEAQIAGENDSWAIRWYASAFLAGMYTLYPGISLVRNIGMDGSGRHSRRSRAFEGSLASGPVSVPRIPVIENQVAREAFADFFRLSERRSLRGITHRIRGFLSTHLGTRGHVVS